MTGSREARGMVVVATTMNLGDMKVHIKIGKVYLF
jgi:hypothetical protein